MVALTGFSYTVNRISDIINAKIVSVNKSISLKINGVITDSRNITGNCSNSLFIALKGERYNAHDYISEAYQKGVRHFVIDLHDFETEKFHDAVFFLVNNALDALHKLAALHRKCFTIPVIGITGSHGKTIVKEWLFQLLSNDKNIVKSPGSYNSQVGVPLSVLNINQSHELGIFEAGISLPEEMCRLQRIIDPTIGILTNIGAAHDTGFKNMQHKINEKLVLFQDCETIIFPGDKQFVLKNITAAYPGKKLIYWGSGKNATIKVSRVISNNNSTTLFYTFQNKSYEITFPFISKIMLHNLLTCLTVMAYLGYPHHVIAGKMKTLKPIPMRLEVSKGINNCTIINDSYNTDMESMILALEFLNNVKQHEKKAVVLSDIYQAKQNPEKLYKEVARQLKQHNISHISGIGKDISKWKNLFPPESHFFTTTESFIQNFKYKQFEEQTILLKGARKFKFENIFKLLQQKAHKTILEINLNHLIHNLNYFKSCLKPKTKIMVMLKALGYGSGVEEIAHLLEFNHIDYIAVAYSDEGVTLRKSGISTPIMVMNPEYDAFEAMLYYNLEPEIYCPEILQKFISFLSSKNLKIYTSPYSNKKNKFKIHIKVDTGMHRLGFMPKEIPGLISQLKNTELVKVETVFTHLSAADNKQFDTFTNKQLSDFSKICDQIKRGIGYHFMRHALNSAGIMRFPGKQLDMVRLGIGLYGISPVMSENKLLQVATFKTIISQIKTIKKGETVSYNRSGKTKKDTIIAILPVGYADGISRKLGNGKHGVYIQQKYAPFVGDICMDMCMVDVSKISCKQGEQAIIFSPDHPVTDLAKKIQTIPYEVMTGISERVKRVYYQE